jgi:hypothetical protein
MLHLNLFWAFDVKLMYENFFFFYEKKYENDYIIKAIETKILI